MPHYLDHLTHKGKWITLWFPQNREESLLIQDRFPRVTSLRSILELFPQIMLSEIGWMFPVSIIGIFLALFIYYQNIKWALLGLIPFLSGLGLTLIVSLLTQNPLSFISLIGLIMVLGFSFDYAIFILDLELERLDSIPATLSGLWYAAITTLCGFIPLIFCHHKVLSQLGLALVCGVLGSLLGTFWGIPPCVRRLKR